MLLLTDSLVECLKETENYDRVQWIKYSDLAGLSEDNYLDLSPWSPFKPTEDDDYFDEFEIAFQKFELLRYHHPG